MTATAAAADVAGVALRHVAAGDAEALVIDSDEQLTRFASNAIHQNVAERSLRLHARVVHDSRMGVAEAAGSDPDALAARVMRAADEARRVSPATDVPPLPNPDGATTTAAAYSDATAAATPEQRADLVGEITSRAAAHGLRAYGFVSTAQRETAVASTRGVQRSAVSTRASSLVVMMGEAGSGYASRHSTDITQLDVIAMAEEALDTCLRNQNAEAIEPGTYEVVLSPYAVVDMLEHLGWVGLSALAVQEHRSFMRIGERVMSDSVTIRDDASDPALFPYPFDYEGVATQPVDVIRDGVSRAVLYDTPTAVRDSVRSTGHSLAQPNTYGPYASHLVMLGGDKTVGELIAPVRRGLYVTRFWYVRDVDPLRTIITGMTREGTFLIEDGEVRQPVRDLRFTQGIVDALTDVRGISRERRVELGEGESGVLAPWLHLGAFTFTS